MAGNDLGLVVVKSEELASLCGNEAVGGSVEAVAANAVLLIPLVGKSIHISLGLEISIEGGVEYAYVGNVGHNCLASRNTLERGRTVEGVDGNNGLDIVKLLIAENAGLVDLAAVNEAVTYCAYLAYVSDNAKLGIGKELENESDSLVVRGHGILLLVVGLTGTLVSDGTRKTDLFAKTSCQDLARSHIKKLILKRAASCIDNQDFHVSYFLSFKGQRPKVIFYPSIISKKIPHCKGFDKILPHNSARIKEILLILL